MCNSLEKPSLTSLVDYNWSTAGLQVNSSSVKRRLMSSPFLLVEGNPVLLMTPKDGCATSSITLSEKKEEEKSYKLFVTCYTWHMTCDMWHVTNGVGWTSAPNCRSLALTVWEWRCLKKIQNWWLIHRGNQSQSYLGLSNTYVVIMVSLFDSPTWICGSILFVYCHCSCPSLFINTQLYPQYYNRSQTLYY